MSVGAVQLQDGGSPGKILEVAEVLVPAGVEVEERDDPLGPEGLHDRTRVGPPETLEDRRAEEEAGGALLGQQPDVDAGVLGERQLLRDQVGRHSLESPLDGLGGVVEILDERNHGAHQREREEGMQGARQEEGARVALRALLEKEPAALHHVGEGSRQLVALEVGDAPQEVVVRRSARDPLPRSLRSPRGPGSPSRRADRGCRRPGRRRGCASGAETRRSPAAGSECRTRGRGSPSRRARRRPRRPPSRPSRRPGRPPPASGR